MDSNRKWKRPGRLDSVLNVLLVVLALGVLGLSAVEVRLDNAVVAVSNVTPALA